MSIFVLIIVFCFVTAFLMHQIYLLNLNRIVKFIIIVLIFFLSCISVKLSLFLIPIFLVILKNKFNKKFNKTIVTIISVIVTAFSFNAVKNYIVFVFKCYNRDYYIKIVDNNYTYKDIDNMYIDFPINDIEKNKSKYLIHDASIYKDENRTKIIAKVYNVNVKNSYLDAELGKIMHGGADSQKCGYSWGGMVKYNYEAKQILQDNLNKRIKK